MNNLTRLEGVARRALGGFGRGLDYRRRRRDGDRCRAGKRRARYQSREGLRIRPRRSGSSIRSSSTAS